MAHAKLTGKSVMRVVTSVGHTVTIRLCFFQAEDGIRDDLVTGVQTCALPISVVPAVRGHHRDLRDHLGIQRTQLESGTCRAAASTQESERGTAAKVLRLVQSRFWKIGRASCRERV